MSDDDFRRMSESQLIDMTLAAGQGGFGGAERMRYGVRRVSYARLKVAVGAP